MSANAAQVGQDDSNNEKGFKTLAEDDNECL
jgi:hypothetical protein